VRPRVRRVSARGRDRRQAIDEAAAPARVAEPEEAERREAGDDQEELKHLVVDRRRQAAERHVREHDRRREDDARVEVPAEQRLEETAHRVHRDARREDRHDRERQGIEGARLLVEAQAQVLRNRARARAVVERHHEHADEDHRRHRAQPVEVAGRDPVLRARGGHPDDLMGAQVRRQEREPGDPGGKRSSGQEEIRARPHRAPEDPADPQDEGEVDRQDQEIDGDRLCGMHRRSISWGFFRQAGTPFFDFRDTCTLEA